MEFENQYLLNIICLNLVNIFLIVSPHTVILEGGKLMYYCVSRYPLKCLIYTIPGMANLNLVV